VREFVEGGITIFFDDRGLLELSVLIAKSVDCDPAYTTIQFGMLWGL